MPLELPNLDDRTYDDLIAEALRLIPTHSPEWTNHNPSDPGITLIELFAYLTELLIYRLNQVTDANKAIFLKLILGVDEWKKLKIRVLQEKQPLSRKLEEQPDDLSFIQETLGSQTLEREIQTAIKQLRQSDRAVTCEDYETLAIKANESDEVKNIVPKVKVTRVKCIPRRDLTLVEPQRFDEQPGHVSIIIVPEVSDAPENPALLTAIKNYLEPKRLLTIRLHIVAPRYLTVGIRITLVLKSGAREETVKKQIGKALEDFFHPLRGGLEGKGWEFGRNIYISEIYELLDRQPGIDYVEKTVHQITRLPIDELVVADEKRKHSVNGQLSAVEVNEDELVNFQFIPKDIILKSPISAIRE